LRKARVKALFVSFAAASTLLALGAIGGCSSQRNDVLLNPSPELDTLSARRDDMVNTRTMVVDTNLRSFNGDLERFFLLDRPSRLTPEPVR